MNKYGTNRLGLDNQCLNNMSFDEKKVNSLFIGQQSVIRHNFDKKSIQKFRFEERSLSFAILINNHQSQLGQTEYEQTRVGKQSVKMLSFWLIICYETK